MKLINKYLLEMLVALLAIFASSNLLGATVNYCDDKQTNKKWERLATSNSEPEFKELNKLRNELCDKIDKGSIDLDTAIDLFEAERSKKIKKLKQRRQKIVEEPGSITG